MNIRNILIISIALIMIVSVSAVNAGLFDFSGNDSGIIDGNIKSSSYNFRVVPSTEVSTGNQANLAYFDCDIEIELNASEDQLNKLQNAIDENKTIDIAVVPEDTAIISDVSSNKDNITINDLFSELSLDNNVLSVHVKNQPADNFNNAVSDSSEGSITSGKLIISEENLEINF